MSLGLALYGIVHREIRGTRELITCSLIGCLWASANALEMAGSDLPTKLVWANLQYLAYGFSPVAWLAMVFRFSGRDRFLSARTLAPLIVIPAVTSVLVWFDPTLGFVRHSFSLDTSGSFPVIAKKYGPWFWVHYVYSYALNLTSVCLLVAAIRKRGSIYRYQARVILLGLGLIFASNMSYVLRVNPIKSCDLTPVVFNISAVILWWGIFRYRIFKILPIARETVFERMADGIIVVDEERNLVDSNEAAGRIFGLRGAACSGRNLRDMLPELSEALGGELPGPEAAPEAAPESIRWEMRIERNGAARFYEVSACRLLDQRYRNAWVLIVSDITDLHNARDQVMRQREELAALEERDRLARELHDNLGQILSFAVIESEAGLREIERGNTDKATAYLKRLRDVLDSSHSDLRGFVHRMKESVYAAIPVESLLRQEAEAFTATCGLPVALSVAKGSMPRLSAARKADLIGLVKEALTNIARHAKASHVSISLVSGKAGESLCIEDNGAGFDPALARAAGGMGLANMEARASALGGRLKVDSARGAGTRLVLTLPAYSDAEEGSR